MDHLLDRERQGCPSFLGRKSGPHHSSRQPYPHRLMLLSKNHAEEQQKRWFSKARRVWRQVNKAWFSTQVLTAAESVNGDKLRIYPTQESEKGTQLFFPTLRSHLPADRGTSPQGACIQLCSSLPAPSLSLAKSACKHQGQRHTRTARRGLHPSILQPF